MSKTQLFSQWGQNKEGRQYVRTGARRQRGFCPELPRATGSRPNQKDFCSLRLAAPQLKQTSRCDNLPVSTRVFVVASRGKNDKSKRRNPRNAGKRCGKNRKSPGFRRDHAVRGSSRLKPLHRRAPNPNFFLRYSASNGIEGLRCVL